METKTTDQTNFESKHTKAPQPTRKEDSFGDVLSFGLSDCDQLGHGVLSEEDELGISTPRIIQKLTRENVCAIASGGLHNLALTTEGIVFSWGCNDDNALGRVGSIAEPTMLPAPVQGLEKKIICISAGDCHSAAVDEDGVVFTWGTYKDKSGYLGYAKGVEKKETASRVPLKKKITSVHCGGHHTFALTKTNEAYGWGDADLGQTGRIVGPRLKLSSGVMVPVPVHVPRVAKELAAERKIVGLFCGIFHSVFFTAGDRVFSTGLNNHGQLGVGDTENRYLLTHVPTLDNQGAIAGSGGEHFSIVRTSNGDLFSFGRGSYGQLGLGDLDNRNIPTKIQALAHKQAIHITCGVSHALAIFSDGDVMAWGDNDSGQLGIGREGLETTPQLVTAESLNNRAVISASAGAMHSLLLSTRPQGQSSNQLSEEKGRKRKRT